MESEESMSKVLKEFLALRQALRTYSVVEEDHHDAERPKQHKDRPLEISTAPNNRSDERNLVTYFVDLLAAHPSAGLVEDRQRLAHYLVHGLLHRYGDPDPSAWRNETSIDRSVPDSARWTVRCPVGHLTDEAVDSHEVLGWVCEVCKRNYDPTECRMVLCGVSGSDSASQELE
jgi:hypothetical protein